MTRIIVNTALFQLGWWSGILGAASGLWWLGIAMLVVIAPAQARLHAWTRSTGRDFARMWLVVGVLGGLVDSLLWAFGLIALAPEDLASWLFVPWVLGLWINFAFTVRISFRWFEGRHLLNSALGAFGGASTYFTGSLLGAVRLHENSWISVGAIAAEWAVLFPLVMHLALKMDPRENASAQGGDA